MKKRVKIREFWQSQKKSLSYLSKNMEWNGKFQGCLDNIDYKSRGFNFKKIISSTLEGVVQFVSEKAQSILRSSKLRSSKLVTQVLSVKVHVHFDMNLNCCKSFTVIEFVSGFFNCVCLCRPSENAFNVQSWKQINKDKDKI